jgi:hypothetical protein
MAMLDLRRTDQRQLPHAGGPVWLTSAEINKAADDTEAVLFSFPKASQKIFIHQAVLDISEAFAGGTVAMTIGSGTLATDAVTTAGTCTNVDVDDYLNATDLSTMGSAIMVPAINSDLGVAILANTMPATARLITGAASTVPCIYAALTSSGTITAGKARLKLLVSILDDI